MDDAPHTDDLDLSVVRTREDLAALLRRVHKRADGPSLRTLEARTRHSSTPLSKTVVSEMLKGVRFPRRAVMSSFIRACGVPDDAMEPWQRAWERVADSQEALALPLSTHTAPDSQLRTQRSSGSASETQVQNAPADQAYGELTSAEQMEIQQLRHEVGKLTIDNEKLRLQLTGKSHIPSVQISPVHDLAATVFMGSQDRAVRYFAMDDITSARLFYSDLAKHIQGAKEKVYILGRGFHLERSSSVYKRLIHAEREALRHGVEIIRIQTGSPVAATWAESYAQMLEDFPGRFRMMADLDGTSYNDVILIDPRGNAPVVSFIFETREPGPIGKPIVALFLINERKLAANLTEQLGKHAEGLVQLYPETVRALASKYVYFAWGVHMATGKLLRSVPDALPLGKAILYEWQRHIKGMLSGPADRATIEYTGKREDAFDGVAYELSWWGKARIDRLERRAYGAVDVEIKLHGKVYQAFTYVPLPAVTEKTELARGSWIHLVVEGAQENEMTGLLTELRDCGVRIDDGKLWTAFVGRLIWQRSARRASPQLSFL
jgi:hypothetical protein